MSDFATVDAAAEACTHRDKLPGTLGPHHYVTNSKRERDGSWTERVEVFCKVCNAHLSTKVTTDSNTLGANSFTEYHNEVYRNRINRKSGSI